LRSPGPEISPKATPGIALVDLAKLTVEDTRQIEAALGELSSFEVVRAEHASRE
jgi:hypothetical protein